MYGVCVFIYDALESVLCYELQKHYLNQCISNDQNEMIPKVEVMTVGLVEGDRDVWCSLE